MNYNHIPQEFLLDVGRLLFNHGERRVHKLKFCRSVIDFLIRNNYVENPFEAGPLSVSATYRALLEQRKMLKGDAVRKSCLVDLPIYKEPETRKMSGVEYKRKAFENLAANALKNPPCLPIKVEPKSAIQGELPMKVDRLSIPSYALELARVAAQRSEDPWRKVGAVAMTEDNRVIATAYNGLAPGYSPQASFWHDRDKRQKFMLHAEINLCSLIRRGEAATVATTTMPCTSCMQALVAHGIKRVYYGEIYEGSEAPEIASRYGVQLLKS